MHKLNIVIVSNNIFAINGIRGVMTRLNIETNVIDIDFCEKKFWNVISNNIINIIILVECNRDMAGIRGCAFISKLKMKYPKVLLGMCSSQLSNSSFLNNYIDFHFYLDDPLVLWLKRMSQFVSIPTDGKYYKKTNAFLSVKEWVVLDGLKHGMMIGQIAKHTQMPYSSVSSAKNRAMRKMGLSNKLALLLFLTR